MWLVAVIGLAVVGLTEANVKHGIVPLGGGGFVKCTSPKDSSEQSQ